FERPEGVKIAAIFIGVIVIMSLVSRTLRSMELRVLGVRPDAQALQLLEEVTRGRAIRIVANRPGDGSLREYEDKLNEARDSHHLPDEDPVLFLEIRP